MNSVSFNWLDVLDGTSGVVMESVVMESVVGVEIGFDFETRSFPLLFVIQSNQCYRLMA